MDIMLNASRVGTSGAYVPGRAPVPAELPPFPTIAVRALRLAWNRDDCLRELHELIRSDAAFSAELLRVANCPLYGIRSQIKSTMQATMLLGFERVKAVILMIGMRSYLGSALKVPALKACWRHSLACATITEELAKVNFLGARLGGYEGLIANPKEDGANEPKADPVYQRASDLLDKDVAYTAGMIHDLGRLALVASKPHQYAELLRTAGDGSRDMLQREREAFGTDHCEMGESMARAWNLPEQLVEVISQHHAPSGGNHLHLLAAVHFGCRMADVLGFDVGGCFQPSSYEELIAELPEAERRHFDCDPEELTRAVEAKLTALDPG